MSFPLKIIVAFIFTFHQLVAGAEICIWCNKKTENDFLACFSEKIGMNRELNIEPDILEAMVKSLPAASSVINTADNVKNKIMNGALSGEVVALITSINLPGRNRDIIVANIIRPLEECYAIITGLSGTKFATSIGKTVMDTMLDVDSDGDSNEYSLRPGSGFSPNNDYPNPPPIIENSPFPSPNQAFSVIQHQRNFEPPQQTPFRSLPPPAGDIAPSSFQQDRQFASNARKNIDIGAPIQGSSPVSYAHSSANAPQNGDNYASFHKRDFPPSGSYTFAGANTPQNGDNYAPFQNQKFPASDSYAFNSANAPPNGDNYTQFQRPDFPTSGSYASASANTPQNGNNYGPFQNRNFPLSDSHVSTDLNAAQDGNAYPTFQRNLPTSDSYGPGSSDVGKSRDNYASFPKQDFVLSNSDAATNSNVGQNEENYKPNNNGHPFSGRNNKLISYSSVIPQNPSQSTPIISQSNQPPFIASPAARLDSKGTYHNDGINSNGQPINPLVFSPEERNVNRSPPESNVASSGSSSAEKNNYVFKNYPNNTEANAYKDGNLGPNGYYNDYGNNRWIANGQPSYDSIPQDYDYNPINSPVPGINSDGNQLQMTQNLPDTFPLQENLPPNFLPLNDQAEYLNSDNQFAVPASFAVPNSKDKDSGMRLIESNEGAFSLQQAPKQGNNNQPKGPFSFAVPQSDDNGFEMRKPTSDEGNSSLLQNKFNEGSQTTSNRQMNTLENSKSVPRNGLNSEETPTQTTTVTTAQVPTTPASIKAPATTKPNVLPNKTCALEFAEANFIHLSESDTFNCEFNEDAPHDQAVSVAANAVQNAFSTNGLANLAYKSKRNCIREVSRLSSGATSQKYAEKISKCTTIILYKNGLLKKNCKEAGKLLADKILNEISYISDSSNADNNEQNKEKYENKTPFQIDDVPNTDSSNIAASVPTNSDSESPENYNAPQSNNAPSSASANAVAVSDGSEGVVPNNFNGPQSDSAPDIASADSLASSQRQEGAPVSNHPLRELQRPWNNKKRRGKFPGISDNNVPDDATSGINAETPVSSLNSYVRNPNYYNAPQPNNAPSSASADAVVVSEVSEGGGPNNYNGPQSDSAPDTASAGSLSAPQVSEGGAPVSNYPLRGQQRPWNNNRRRGRHPSISDKNAPDDATSGTNAETPALSQNSYVRNPNYYNAPQPNNAPSSASADTVDVSEGSEGGISDNYNGPQSDSALDAASTDSLASSQGPEGAPVSNHLLRELQRPWNNKKRRGKHPGIFDNNAPDDATSGTNAETPVSSQNSYLRNPNYYNAPQPNNAPSSASADAVAVSEGSEGGIPDNYNGPQSDSAPDAASADSLAAYQVPEGALVSNHPLRELQRPWNNKKRRGKFPGISDNNVPDDATSGINAETPVSSQNSYARNPNYYNAPQPNNAPDAAASAIATVPQGQNSGSPNNLDNKESNIPTSNEQPSVESNGDKSGISNSKENPLLNKLKDPDSKNHIDYLMKTAINCVSPGGFNYKAFTIGMASVATAMKKQHPNESPETIIGKTYLAAIVALIEDFQNAVFSRQENDEPQSRQSSQPPPNIYRSNSESAGYGPSTNQQNSGSSVASVVNSKSASPGYQDVGNYQNTFQAIPLKGNPLQTYTNPSLQNAGQNSWYITNGNNLLNAGPRELPQSFNYNQDGGFAYAASG